VVNRRRSTRRRYRWRKPRNRRKNCAAWSHRRCLRCPWSRWRARPLWRHASPRGLVALGLALSLSEALGLQPLAGELPLQHLPHGRASLGHRRRAWEADLERSAAAMAR